MIILDANAAVAMSMGSDMGRALSSLCARGEPTIAPRLLFSEVIHSVAKYERAGLLSADEALAHAQKAISIVDEFYDEDDLWAEVMSESMRLGHSSYDMFYFVLARRHVATLFTLDRRLQRLCLENGVNAVCLDELGD